MLSQASICSSLCLFLHGPVVIFLLQFNGRAYLLIFHELSNFLWIGWLLKLQKRERCVKPGCSMLIVETLTDFDISIQSNAFMMASLSDGILS